MFRIHLNLPAKYGLVNSTCRKSTEPTFKPNVGQPQSNAWSKCGCMGAVWYGMLGYICCELRMNDVKIDK